MRGSVGGGGRGKGEGGAGHREGEGGPAVLHLGRGGEGVAESSVPPRKGLREGTCLEGQGTVGCVCLLRQLW